MSLTSQRSQFYRIRHWLLIHSLVFSWLAPISGEDSVESYVWHPLKIGGGGWVVGLDIHPGENDLKYIRTDVSGAYRWDPLQESWVQLVTAQSMPPEYVAYSTYRGVDSIVSSASNPEIVYMAYRGEIFRSSDCGQKWIGTNFSKHSVKMDPNGAGRQEGERLAVDPVNSHIVYYGSIENGLWRTVNSGETWERIVEIPLGMPQHGVNTIVFDPASKVVEQSERVPATSRIYVSTDGTGIFCSDDAGKTWISIADDGPGSTASIRETAIGPDRNFYIVCDRSHTNAGAVWAYQPSGQWMEITPQGSLDYWAIAVNPNDPAQLVVMCQGGRTFVSKNQGTHWSSHGFSLETSHVQWLGRQQNHWLSIGECRFDSDGKLWLAEGFGVWWADDLETNKIHWQEASRGIEETCGNDVIAPPGGAPLAAVWDVGVFRFPSTSTYTAERGIPYFMSAWALDWCPNDPSFLVGVFRNHLGFPPHINESGYSTDGGRSWTIFPSLTEDTHPKELEYGAIAVAANNTDHMVWVPANDHLPHYSTDRGTKWKQSSFNGKQTTGFRNRSSPIKPLCADRVLADTFYYYRTEDGVYRSTDAGATFSKAGSPVTGRYNSILKAAPENAGHLWFAEGSQGTRVDGIWRSQDGGESWTELPVIEQAYNFGFGKPLTPQSYPTLFVAGVAKGETGIWRSTDEGMSWSQIGEYPLGIFDWIDAMDGDKKVFGKIYLAFASAGLAFGELENKP